MVYPFALADCFENYTYGEELTVFNLLFDFRNQSEITNLYYDYDLHMNKEGYGLMAKGIYTRLINTAEFNAIITKTSAGSNNVQQ